MSSRNPYHKWTSKEVELIKELYVEKEMTVDEIATEINQSLGLSTTAFSIYQIIHKNGISRPKRSQRVITKKFSLTQSERDEMSKRLRANFFVEV